MAGMKKTNDHADPTKVERLKNKVIVTTLVDATTRAKLQGDVL